MRFLWHLLTASRAARSLGSGRACTSAPPAAAGGEASATAHTRTCAHAHTQIGIFSRGMLHDYVQCHSMWTWAEHHGGASELVHPHALRPQRPGRGATPHAQPPPASMLYRRLRAQRPAERAVGRLQGRRASHPVHPDTVLGRPCAAYPVQGPPAGAVFPWRDDRIRYGLLWATASLVAPMQLCIYMPYGLAGRARRPPPAERRAAARGLINSWQWKPVMELATGRLLLRCGTSRCARGRSAPAGPAPVQPVGASWRILRITCWSALVLLTCGRATPRC